MSAPLWQQHFPSVLDMDTLAARTVTELRRTFDSDLVAITVVEQHPGPVIRAVAGDRSDGILPGMPLPPGALGRLTISKGDMVFVTNYANIHSDAEFLDLIVGFEGIRAAVGVPLRVRDRTLGDVFVGRRSHDVFTGNEVNVLYQAAHNLAPMVETSLQAQRQVELASAQERNRMATDLHDNVLPLLFAIGATARRMRDGDGRDVDWNSVIAELETVEALASSAGSMVRDAVRELAPIRADHKLPLRLRSLITRYKAHHPVSVELIESGQALALCGEVTDAMTAVVNEGLANLVKHAPGASAIVTLHFSHNDVTVTVDDDGPGLPDDFVLGSLTSSNAGERFGLSNLARRVADLGGSLSVAANEDNGVTLRACIPAEPR